MDNGDILKAIGELKTDMSSLRAELKTDMGSMEARLRTELVTMEERLREYVHDTETRIVGEFYKYAQSMDGRLRTTEVTIPPIIDRLVAIESRLLDVERRLNLPGAH